jgi:membrane protein DedA with SNARE-associated domain
MRRVCCGVRDPEGEMTMDRIVHWIMQLDPFWAYVAITVVSFIENVFPPFPSDVIVVAIGSLIGLGRMDYLIALLMTSVGSTIGFMVMYEVGDWFGARILESGRLKFLPIDQVHRAEAWFRKYGAWIIVANRFMSGTRAIISFFVGMSDVPPGRSAVFAFLSSLGWYALLLFAGRELGANWHEIGFYLEAYGELITFAIVLGIALIVLVRYARRRRISPDTDRE